MPQEVVEIAGVGRGGPGAAEQFGIVHLQPQRRPAAGGVSGQQAARGLGVHAVLAFQVGDQLGRQRLAPRPVVDAVDELARAGGARLVDPHPDHRRRLARLHLIPPGDGDVVEGAQRAAEALGVVDRRIALAGMGRIVRRCHHPAAQGDRPAPEAAERRAGEVDRVDVGLGRRIDLLHRRRHVGQGLEGIGFRDDGRKRQELGCVAGQVHLHHPAHEIARAASSVVVAVVAIEHRLHGVAAGLELREGCGEGRDVSVEIDRGAGLEVRHLLSGDGGRVGIDLVHVDPRDGPLVGGTEQLGEDQQPAGDRRRRGLAQAHMKHHRRGQGRAWRRRSPRRPAGCARGAKDERRSNGRRAS